MKKLNLLSKVAKCRLLIRTIGSNNARKLFGSTLLYRGALRKRGVKTIYPFDYNKNSPFANPQDYINWRMHLYQMNYMNRVAGLGVKAKIREIHVVVPNADRLKATINMESLINQALNILSEKGGKK